METLLAGDAVVTIDHEHGGRLSSLVVAGHELLVTEVALGPMGWGCFPMIPWAGRIRHGRFTSGERAVELPLGMPPHAIHGTTYTQPWTATGPGELSCRFGNHWPWPGTARQRIELTPGALTLTIRLDADGLDPMPVTAGWHPWFRRTVGGAPVSLSLPPGARRWQRDAEGIPDGTLVEPGPGPFDDCFADVRWPVELVWPGVLRLRIESSCADVVIYDEPAHAVCVEPQSGPPDAHNSGTDLAMVDADHPFACTTTWTWDESPVPSP